MDDLHRIYGELPADPDAMAISRGAPAPGSTTHRPPLESVPYTIDEAIADSIEQLTGEPFPDPFTGHHDIQYWIWTGDRLVPASPEAAERIQQQELLEQAEIRRQRERQLASRQQRLDSTVYLARRLLVPLHHMVQKWRGIDRRTKQNHDIIESTVSESSRHSE